MISKSDHVIGALVTPEDIAKAGITVPSFLLHPDAPHRFISVADLPEMLGVKQ
jgi:hypothetical protein